MKQEIQRGIRQGYVCRRYSNNGREYRSPANPFR